MSKRTRHSLAIERAATQSIYPVRKRVRRCRCESSARKRKRRPPTSANFCVSGVRGGGDEEKDGGDDEEDDKDERISTMVQLYRCNTTIESELRENFVAAACFVDRESDEYEHYREQRQQTTLHFHKGVLSYNRSPRRRRIAQNLIIETFDDDSLEIQAAIEFGIFRHQAQLPAHQQCDLLYATIMPERQSIRKFWNCVRTGARLNCQLIAIDVQYARKKTFCVLNRALHSLQIVGYTCRVVRLGSHWLLLAVPTVDEQLTRRLETLAASAAAAAAAVSQKSAPNQNAKILHFVRAVLRPSSLRKPTNFNTQTRAAEMTDDWR